MIGEDKIRFFMEEKVKVHITLKPNSRFPRGKFQNGYIKEISAFKMDPTIKYIRFLDDVDGLIRLFPDEFDDMEEFKEK